MLALLTAAACGALLTVALPPTGLWPAALALVPLFALVASASTPRRAFQLGAAFALTFFGLYIFWLPLSFSRSDMLGPFFWVLFPLLVAVLCLFWGAVTWASRILGGRGAGTLWLLPALWILMEWLRTQGYLGFPWGTLGYLWLDTPVAQLGAVVGTYGLGLLTTAAAALLAAPFVRVAPAAPGGGRPRRRLPRWLPAALGSLLVAGAFLAGGRALRAPLPEATETAVLVQGNVDPFGRAISPTQDVDVHLELSRRAVAALETRATFVIWPEGAVLGYGLEGMRAQGLRDAIQASAPGSAFIVGGRAYDGGRSYNSAYSLAGAQILGRYDKAYLVPFGERWPLLQTAAPLYRAVFGLLHLPMLAGTTPGAGPTPLETPEGPVATYICYESVFPQVARRMVADGARLLVNITNDAWFSRGNGAQQHFDMGRMRAIETHRYLLRAGNDGITAVIDPRGAVTERLARHLPSTLVGRFALLDDRTPFVRYGGLYLPALAVYALAAAAVLLRRRRA